MTTSVAVASSFFTVIVILLALSDAAVNEGGAYRVKRILPESESRRCNPTISGDCKKGDWVDEGIADCSYRGSWPWSTCTASGDSGGVFSWVVEPDSDDKCKPVSGKGLRCGAQGSNTRCVCSDYKIQFNECVCQYWTEGTPGEDQPAFCNAYYLGGTSGVHQFACCNNCNDLTPSTCDGVTYQGGSTTKYCGSCGAKKENYDTQWKSYFNCGSCDVQSACKKRCDGNFPNKLPGFCWRWLDCFSECCRAASYQPRQKQYRSTSPAEVASMAFCGDYRCSESETPATCPADCCYQANALNCSSDPSQCSPDCCQMETCCLAGTGGVVQSLIPFSSLCLSALALAIAINNI